MTFPALSLPQLYFNENFFRCFLKLAETTVYKTSDYLLPKEERGGGWGWGCCRRIVGDHMVFRELRGDQLSLTEYKGGEDYILLPACKGGWD